MKSKILKFWPVLATIITIIAASAGSSASGWFLYQPKVPKYLK